jgi:NitT/TauT family transport system substrate-binding protein
MEESIEINGSRLGEARNSAEAARTSTNLHADGCCGWKADRRDTSSVWMDRLLFKTNRAIIELGKIVPPILCQNEILGKAGEFAVKAVWQLPLCVAVVFLVLADCRNAGAETLRIGLQKTGTLAWQLDVIARHGFARESGLDLDIRELASPEAGKLALNGGTVDVAVVDWLWAARERALGQALKFYPYSTAVGAIMVKENSPLRQLSDIKGHSLAIAGGALDKSWLVVRAAAQRRGTDLSRQASLMFGAPPLLYEKLRQGEADASLNFWNFCARLESQGYRRLYDVRDAEADLGLAQPIAMIGYVFSEAFLSTHPGTIDRFLDAVQKADRILLQDDAEWEALRPLMAAEDQATFEAYRATVRNTVPRRSIDEEEADARKLFRTLADIGGADLVGPSHELDERLYYRHSSTVPEN